MKVAIGILFLRTWSFSPPSLYEKKAIVKAIDWNECRPLLFSKVDGPVGRFMILAKCENPKINLSFLTSFRANKFRTKKMNLVKDALLRAQMG